MPDVKSAASKLDTLKIRQRYIIAILVVIALAILLFSADAVVSFIIRYYLPSLDQYISYAWQGSNALIGIVGAYVIYRILASIITIQASKIHARGGGEIQKVVLRVIFIFVAIFVALTAFGISPSGALAGGAVGGVVIGLAAQTTLTSILSGFLLSSSKTLFPGDIVLFKSSYWGSVDIPVKVIRVSTLYTEARTPNGNLVRFPNPLLLNYTILAHLDYGGEFVFPMQVAFNSDVNAAKVGDLASVPIKREFAKMHTKNPEILFSSKASMTNTFTVLITASEFSELNKLMEIVNREFERAYWQLKK